MALAYSAWGTSGVVILKFVIVVTILLLVARAFAGWHFSSRRRRLRFCFFQACLCLAQRERRCGPFYAWSCCAA